MYDHSECPFRRPSIIDNSFLLVSRSESQSLPQWLNQLETVLSMNIQHMDLKDRIQEIALEFPGYGYRRITAELQERGNAVNHKRVLILM